MREERIAVVTGANGFLARNLMEHLNLEGWKVYGVSREVFNSSCAEILTWDAFWSAQTVPPASVNALFHLAAFIPPDKEDSAYADQCIEINAMLTLKLAEFMCSLSQAKFIYSSAGNVYGLQDEPAKARQ